MVYILARDATACRILDLIIGRQKESIKGVRSDRDLSQTPGENAVNSKEDDVEKVVRQFIHATLKAILHTLPPSLVHDALWMYLFLKVRYIIESSKKMCNERAVPRGDVDKVEVEEGHSTQDGRYSSERAEKTADDIGDLSTAVLKAQLLCHDAYSDVVVEYADPNKFNELLRIQRNAAEENINSHEQDVDEAARVDKAAALVDPSERPHFSALWLALSVIERNLPTVSAQLSSSSDNNGVAAKTRRRTRQIASILNPDTLLQLVPDAESLWVLKYLCRCFKLRAWRQICSLTGRQCDLVSPVPSRMEPSAAFLRQCGALSSDEFFHDYDLLLPGTLLRQVCPSWETIFQLCTVSFATERRILRRPCRLFGGKSPPSSPRRPPARGKTDGASQASSDTPFRMTLSLASPSASSSLSPASSRGVPPIAVLINPAVSTSVVNPQRRVKNERLDTIEGAALKYYYHCLTNLAPRRQTLENDKRCNGGIELLGHLQAQLSREAAGPSMSNAEEGGGAELSTGVLPPHRQLQSLQQAALAKESHANFIKNALIGLDIQIMAFSGGAAGYYMGYLSGASTNACLVYAMVGLVGMLLVDTILVLIRMGKQDQRVIQQKKEITRKRGKLPAESPPPMARTHPSDGKESSSNEQGEAQTSTGASPCGQSYEAFMDMKKKQ